MTVDFVEHPVVPLADQRQAVDLKGPRQQRRDTGGKRFHCSLCIAAKATCQRDVETELFHIPIA